MPPTAPDKRARASADDVFRDYGAAVLFLGAFEIWCSYDGWFNEDCKSITFNRAAAFIILPFLIFSLVMAISAGLTLQKQKRQKPPAGN